MDRWRRPACVVVQGVPLQKESVWRGAPLHIRQRKGARLLRTRTEGGRKPQTTALWRPSIPAPEGSFKKGSCRKVLIPALSLSPIFGPAGQRINWLWCALQVDTNRKSPAASNGIVEGPACRCAAVEVNESNICFGSEQVVIR